MPASRLLAGLRRLLGGTGRGDGGAAVVRPAAVYVAELPDSQRDPASVRRVSPEGEFAQPALSPSGHAVLYWGATDREPVNGIWLTPLDGAPRRLSHGDALEGHPAWSADQQRLVYFSTEGHAPAEPWVAARQFAVDRSPRNLWSMRLDDGQRARLTDGCYVDERPCCAPDGRTVCFVSNRSGRLNLWSVSLDGGAPRQLTDGELDYRPAIAPDGARLAWFTRAARDGSHQLALAAWPEMRPLSFELDRPFRWIHGPHWFADSRRLLVHGLAEGERKPALWVLDVLSGHSERLQLAGFDSASHGSLDTAGRRLAFDSREAPPALRRGSTVAAS
jgi:hypothetical protein